MNSELKPCPFCGTKSVLLRNADDTFWFIECRACQSEFTVKRSVRRGVPQSNEKEVVETWNRRVEAEAHLYTLDELIQLKPLTVVYIQECDDPEEACHVTEWIGQKQVEAGNHAGVEPYTQMLFTHFVEAKEEYNSYWRCWSARPTREQRDLTKWERQNDVATVPEAEAVKQPELTLEDVRAVLAEVSRKGYTAQIRELLLKYGAPKLSGIDPANYKALLEDVEALQHAEMD